MKPILPRQQTMFMHAINVDAAKTYRIHGLFAPRGQGNTERIPFRDLLESLGIPWMTIDFRALSFRFVKSGAICCDFVCCWTLSRDFALFPKLCLH
jgi:hypothetical protein